MKEINFMTIGDKKYYNFIRFSIQKLINFYPRCNVFIYDWGFSDIQIKKLKEYRNVRIIPWKNKLDENGYKKIISRYEGYNPLTDVRKHEYLLIQKPYCMLDCAKKIGKNLVFIDGDALMINPINEIFDNNTYIGVTINPEEFIKKAKQLEIYGPLNSGVIFFILNSNLIQLFLQRWIDQINNTKRVWIEQSALSLLIEKENLNIFNKYYTDGLLNVAENKINIKILPCSIYNLYWVENGFNLKETKIIHLKGRTQSIKKIIVEFKLNFFFNKFLKIFPKFISNRIDKKKTVKTITRFIHASFKSRIKKIRNRSSKISFKIRNFLFKN